MKKSTSPSRQRGVSLIEVMVSMVIGLVVVGAVLVSYLSSGKTSKEQAAYAEMNENAQMALTLISRDLLLAGYAQVTGALAPIPPATVTTFTRTYSGNAVFGCDFGFVTPNTTGAASCAVSGGKPSIEIAYEADINNTVSIVVGSVAAPSDCKGSQIRPADGTLSGVDYFITHNRFYLASGSTGRSELHCASKTQDAGGSAVSGEPLVDNIDDMKFWYGLAPTASSRIINRYVTAGAITTAADWQNVVSVRLCLIVRSSEPVIDMELYPDALHPPTYLDCDMAEQTITDRYLRRAYFSTTTLRNKMAF